MKVCGVVCEYNPFHNGHKYQIDYIKNELGFDAVVGVMSGSFTQRGTNGGTSDKNIRAKAAVQNGMDLVLSFLPFTQYSRRRFSQGTRFIF